MAEGGTLRFFVSILVSALALWMLLRLVRSADPGSMSRVRDALLGLSWYFPALYFGAQLLQGFLRSERYRLLLGRAGDGRKPRWLPVLLVTFVRNMLVDMLPARLGELGYVALLRSGCRIEIDSGIVSMGVSIWLDILALAFVLAGALVATAGGAAAGTMAFMLIFLGVFILAGWWMLFIVPTPVARLWKRITSGIPVHRWHGRVRDFAVALADDLARLRDSGTLLPAIGWSALIRMVKYAGLIILYFGVTREVWPDLHSVDFAKLLIALIAAEGAAALPVPAFMSFGTYEAGGAGALSLLGVSPSEAVLAMLALHIASQVVDYGIGLLALPLFWVVTRERGRFARGMAG